LNPRKTSKCKYSLNDMFEYFKNINNEDTNVNNHNSEQHSNVSYDSFDHDVNDGILRNLKMAKPVVMIILLMSILSRPLIVL